MCASIYGIDIQSATAEIRRGIKEDRKKERKKKPQSKNIMACPIPQGSHKNIWTFGKDTRQEGYCLTRHEQLYTVKTNSSEILSMTVRNCCYIDFVFIKYWTATDQIWLANTDRLTTSATDRPLTVHAKAFCCDIFFFFAAGAYSRLLWPPNRAGRYILQLWFLSSSFFFPRLF